MGALLACVCAHVCKGPRDQRRVGATAVVSCWIGTGNRTLVLCKNSVGSYVLSIQPQEATFLVLSAHFLLPTPRLLGLFSALSWWAARVSASSRPTENTAASFVISPHPLPLPRFPANPCGLGLRAAALHLSLS